MDTLTTQDLAIETEAKHEWLAGRDRCDRCGAQAYVRAVKNNQDLMFCKHDGEALMPALLIQGFAVQDDIHLVFKAEKERSAVLDHA